MPRSLWILALASLTACHSDSETSALAARIDALQQRLPPPPIREKAPRPFSILCPGGWRELGALGAARWVCRSPQTFADGSSPQCSVVALPYDGAWQPREFFELAASLAPELRTTQAYDEGPIVIDTRPGFRTSFERAAVTQAQKSLATLLTEGDFTFVATCTASAAAFADLQPTFQRVVESLRFGKAKAD
ncbi:MAG TPA: hypothetical protein VJR89_12360, partial [Polyangiales bacterium]|nr:hypothetical protein [Polyangiales bacterium]